MDSELMYAVNLGTRGVLEALDVLKYANIRSGTKLSTRGSRTVASSSLTNHHVVLGRRDGWTLEQLATATQRTTANSHPKRPRPCASSTTASSWWSGQLQRPDADLRGPGSRSCCTRTRTWTYDSCSTRTTRSSTATRAASWQRAPDGHFELDCLVATADRSGRTAPDETDTTALSTSGKVGIQQRYRRRRKDHRPRTVGRDSRRLLEDSVSVLRRRRGRQSTDLPAEAVLTASTSASLAQRQLDIADHDQARRSGLAPDHLLPVRDHIAAGRGPSPRRQAHLGHLHHGGLRGGACGGCCCDPRCGYRSNRDLHRRNRSVDQATRVQVDVSHLGQVTVLETHTLADDRNTTRRTRWTTRSAWVSTPTAALGSPTAP